MFTNWLTRTMLTREDHTHPRGDLLCLIVLSTCGSPRPLVVAVQGSAAIIHTAPYTGSSHPPLDTIVTLLRTVFETADAATHASVDAALGSIWLELCDVVSTFVTDAEEASTPILADPRRFVNQYTENKASAATADRPIPPLFNAAGRVPPEYSWILECCYAQ